MCYEPLTPYQNSFNFIRSMPSQASIICKFPEVKKFIWLPITSQMTVPLQVNISVNVIICYKNRNNQRVLYFKNEQSIPDLGHIFLRVSFITTSTQLTFNFLLSEPNCRVVVHFVCVSHFVSLLVILTNLAFNILLILVYSIVLHSLMFIQLLFLKLLVYQGLHLLLLQLLLLLSPLCLLFSLESQSISLELFFYRALILAMFLLVGVQQIIEEGLLLDAFIIFVSLLPLPILSNLVLQLLPIFVFVPLFSRVSPIIVLRQGLRISFFHLLSQSFLVLFIYLILNLASELLFLMLPSSLLFLNHLLVLSRFFFLPLPSILP